MSKKIPWWVKILVKLIFSRLPIGYKFWKNLGLFEHGKMNHHEYSVRVFFDHLDRLGYKKNDLKGLTILELGPGDSIATALIASSFGAKVILVDAGSFTNQDMSTYFGLVRYLKSQGYQAKSIEDCKEVSEILNICSSKLYTEGLNSLKTLKDNSVDLIFSQAVLEHIRLSEFSDTLYEIKRILKRSGICSHQIDLQDHLSGSLNNLRFSNNVWESKLFANSGFYTNRISFTRMLDYFKEVGFEVDIKRVNKWPDLPIQRRKLNKHFKDLPLDELLVKDFAVILRNQLS